MDDLKKSYQTFDLKSLTMTHFESQGNLSFEILSRSLHLNSLNYGLVPYMDDIKPKQKHLTLTYSTNFQGLT